MKASELIKRYNMEGHIENGLFVEDHYEHKGDGRPASGSIYFYVSPGEHTVFHRIDCDEYWIYNAGATAELWTINQEGKLEVRLCGTEEGANPKVYFAAGEIFSARVPANAEDGCFVTCITTPRFCYEGSEMIEKEKMLERYPETAAFWK